MLREEPHPDNFVLDVERLASKPQQEAKLQTLLRLPQGILKIALKTYRFFIRAYAAHWMACPLGALAAVVSTVGAASLMHLISPLWRGYLEKQNSILLNAIAGPLFAYIFYLSVYYFGMFLKERRSLLTEDRKNLDRSKFRAWLKVVKYDYLAHLPSDCYLITLAAIMQAGLEASGSSIFWAIISSQFVDDFITFLKEPAIWAGAKAIADWELRRETA